MYMIVNEFLPAQMRTLHTTKGMQHTLHLHLTASCPSSTTVEVDRDASQSAT